MTEFLVFFVNTLSSVLYIAIIGRVIFSWFGVKPENPLYPLTTFIYQITEPILGPIRRALPAFGMMDLSPMVAIVLLTVIQRALLSIAT